MDRQKILVERSTRFYGREARKLYLLLKKVEIAVTSAIINYKTEILDLE